MMDWAIGAVLTWGKAVIQLFAHPFYYLGILFIVLQYRIQIQLERKLFHTRLHSLFGEIWRVLLWGWIAGIAASLAMAAVGAAVRMEAVLLIWLLALVLMLFRVRFLCFAYSIGIVGVMHALLSLTAWRPAQETAAQAVDALVSLHMPSLLALVAVLHLLEAVLMYAQGSRMAVPLFLQGKRGKIIGGYSIRGFWPVPLFLLVPLSSGGSSFSMPWTPWFAADLPLTGWTFLTFPVIIGFSAETVSELPRDKVKTSATQLAVYGLAALLLALIAQFWPIFVGISSMLVVLLHEAVILLGGRRENSKAPLYVHHAKGLRVLGVLPGTPAAEMGIQPGEIIHRVNGVKVRSKEELHHALSVNPAFCKLEVINRQGESKFLQRAIFSGEHHQLGIILAPDEHALYFVSKKPFTLFSLLRQKRSGLTQKPEQSA
jgi:hypothetical protein